MSVLATRQIQLEKDFTTYDMELVEDEEVLTVLSIYCDYYNQFLEYYDKNGNLICREHCNYNDFT